MLRKSSSCFFLTCSSWQRCFWKIDATTTSRNTKQRQAKKKHITRHHVPYWAILSHIGPYDAPSLQQHNDASTLQWCSCCPWIQHASRFQLPWQTRMQRGTFASKLLQARYIPVLPEPGSENCEIPSNGSSVAALENLCNRGIGIFSANAYASQTLVPTTKG